MVAFGLDQAAFFPPGTFGSGASKIAIEEVNTLQITLEFGGGTGWFKNGDDNVRDAERGIWNILKAMGMIDGELEADGPLCTVYEAGVVIWKPAVDGLFIRDSKFRDELKTGDVYGRLVDPYTGDLAGGNANAARWHRDSERARVAHRRRHLHRHSRFHRPRRRSPNHGPVRLVLIDRHVGRPNLNLSRKQRGT